MIPKRIEPLPIDTHTFCLELLIALTRLEQQARSQDATLEADLAYHLRQSLLDEFARLGLNAVAIDNDVQQITSPLAAAEALIALLKKT